MSRPRIFISIPRTVGHCRDIIRGIFRFQHSRRSWDLNLFSKSMGLEKLLQADGIISMGVDLRGVSIPCVDVSNARVFPELNSVREHNREAGRIAANFFIDQGHSHFAFGSLPGIHYADERLAGFEEVATSRVHTHPIWGKGRSRKQSETLAVTWLEQLPKPIGLMTASDSEALFLMRLLEHMPYSVPEDLSLIGADDDDLTCRMPLVSISSVMLNGEEVGYDAARRLEQLLENPTRPPETKLIPPRGLKLRDSTNVQALQDPIVRKAVAFIRAHAHEAIKVPDICREVSMNRRSLELKIKEALDTSPHRLLMDERLKRAKLLLCDTDLPIKRLAMECGYNSHARFSINFTDEVGMSPRDFRKSNR